MTDLEKREELGRRLLARVRNADTIMVIGPQIRTHFLSPDERQYLTEVLEEKLGVQS